MRHSLIVALVVASAPAAHAAPRLVGYAELPALTFIPGPTSGQFQSPANGVTPPYINQQPVQGVSAILRNKRGGFLVMSDNGFGGKGNSADALLLVHDVSVDFRTRSGGTGTVTVDRSRALSDPDRLLSFPIQADFEFYQNGARNIPTDASIRDQKLLTGWDLDPESFRRLPDGSFVFGDEFGPFLVRTNRDFEVIQQQVATPGVQAPQNPFLVPPANLPGSGGYEGMALSPDGQTLYALLERPVTGETTLRIYEVDADPLAFTGTRWAYPLSPGATAIGDMTAIADRKFIVIERDGGNGPTAAFKRVFLIDLDQADASGNLIKTELVDLLNVPDPHDLNQDGSLTYRMPFVTIEDIIPIDPFTILIGNDNNFPGGGGRIAGVPDDSEFALIRFDDPLFAAVAAPSPTALALFGLGMLSLALRRR